MSATVLVVDDSPEVADLYAAQLAEEYDVRTAYGGEAALAALDGTVDVVLLDRHMPDVDGDEVLARLRDAGHDCRVAMVTAVEPDFDIVELGFDEYVTKPVDRETLLETVEQMLVRAGYSEGLRRYYALVSTRAALEAEKSPSALSDSPEYEALTNRIEALEQDLASTAPDTDDDAEWATLLRTILREQGTS